MLTEAETQTAFVAWLLERAWDVKTDNADHVDIKGRRGAERLIAEVRGHTSEPGLDVDTLYGQILRRIDPSDFVTVYALVVPETLVNKIERVDEAVRRNLGIDVFAVDDFKRVRRLE